MERVFIVIEQNQGGEKYGNGNGVAQCRTLCLSKSDAWDLARQMAEEHLRTRGGFLTVDDEGFQVDEAPDHGQWEASYTVQQVVDFRPPALEFLEKGEL